MGLTAADRVSRPSCEVLAAMRRNRKLLKYDMMGQHELKY